MLLNALCWLQHRPVLYKASWPFPYRAAFVVEMDTEHEFQNARRFAAMVDSRDIRATFYSLTSVAVRFPELVRELAQRHEIAYHADVHDGFKGQPASVQARRLDTMQAQMKSILGDISNVTGFRAPTESYDKTTEDLLMQRGILHHAADPDRTHARVPLFYPNTPGAMQRTLVVLPRTQADDINMLRNSNPDKETLRKRLIGDFDRVLQMGGFGLLSVHSQNFGEGSLLVAALPEFLDHAATYREQVWLAPSVKVADWWRTRERLAYVVSTKGGKLDLDVIVTGEQPLSDVNLIVTNPRADASVRIQAASSGATLPTVKAIDKFRTALVFSDMPAGNYSYSLAFSDDRKE
jgi:peptidoglycan/xylan/chitin deacetylase (PgdA/CDA1 family)